MVHLSSFRKVKAFGRTNFISSTGCPSEHPEQRWFNLASVADNTLHVNCLNAVDTPPLLTQPSGTLTYILATPGMVAAGFPAGSKIAMIA